MYIVKAKDLIMKKTVLRRTAAAILCLLCALSSASCKVVEKTEDTTEAAVTEAPKVEIDMSKPIFKSASYSLNEDETTFYMYNIADILQTNNAGTFGSYGGTDLDLSKSLKDQYIMTGTTWYDYCAQMLSDYVEGYLMFAEEAKKQGLTLSDSEKAIIRKKAEADKDKYAGKISVDLIAQYTELNTLADKCKNKLIMDIDISESVLQAEFEKNTKNYQSVDYSYYSCPFKAESDTTSAETDSSEDEGKLSKEDAAAFTSILKECTTKEQFETELEKLLKQYYPDMKAEDIETSIERSYVKGEMYSEDYAEIPVFSWLFENERAVGDIYYDAAEDTDGMYTVLLLHRAKSSDPSETVNVRHILITTATYGSDDAAKAKAEEILKTFTDSGKSMETFELLSFEFTEDPGSMYTGGLYQNVMEGQMVQTFNDWCFDEARQVGDTGIVKTDYGYHVMYFEGQGLTVGMSTVAGAIQETSYNEKYEEITTTHTVEFYEDRFKAMEF